MEEIKSQIEQLNARISQLTTQLESERVAKLVAEQVAIREKDRADKMSDVLNKIPILEQQINAINARTHSHVYVVKHCQPTRDGYEEFTSTHTTNASHC